MTHIKGFVFFDRDAYRGDPAGVTVSKRQALPAGDFGITEYTWGPTSLWFVDADQFNADERQTAYIAFLATQKHKVRSSR